MKKYILILLILCCLVVNVQAANNIRLNFQNVQDFAEQIACTGGDCRDFGWEQNTTGGNSYITSRYGDVVSSQTPTMMTYAAATCTNINYQSFGLYDVEFNVMYSSATNCASSGDRIEIKILGGTAYHYNNGILKHTSPALTQNPSYISFAGVALDDIIWGSSDPYNENASDKYIFGAPEDGYFLMKDTAEPSRNGFYRVNATPNGTPTIVYSSYFFTSFAKGNGHNETIKLEQYGGGTYQQQYTGTKYTGENTWNLTDFFSESRDAPYGLYVTTIDGSLATSEIIPYIGSGAFIQFDKISYAVGETAIVTVEMSTGYYDTDVYSYHVILEDAYLNEVVDLPISISSSVPNTGTVEYTWTSDDDNGIYYGLIYATRLEDNKEFMMNYDTCELSGQLTISGIVKDGETTSGITTAIVNITQGTVTDSVSSGYDGNYTTVSLAFVSDVATTIFAYAPGYENYTHVFTPLRAGLLEINLTLLPVDKTYYGIALGGIARTPPYNITVDSATVTIQNATSPTGNYTVTTNSAGYYLNNYMPNNYWWTVWGNKTGYNDSRFYYVLVNGT